MHTLTQYRPLRAVLFCIAALVTVFVTPFAAAATVSDPGACGRTAEVIQWTPQKGAIARFVVDTFVSNLHSHIWIGLGRDGTSFWSAEAGEPSDACDDCRSLQLVETQSNGKRTVHSVITSTDYDRLGNDPAARKAHALSTLWKLSRTKWPADKLTQTYTLTVGKPPANAPDADPPFAAQVVAKGINLRFNLGASKLMCWCLYEWNATK